MAKDRCDLKTQIMKLVSEEDRDDKSPVRSASIILQDQRCSTTSNKPMLLGRKQ